jgi:hypothetical protein
VITLAKTQERLVDLEGLMQGQRQREMAAALDTLSAEQAVALCILCFLLRDQSGPPVMDTPQCVAWLRAGMQERGLPCHVRPYLAQAHSLAQRFLASVPGDLPVPELMPFYEWIAAGWDDRHQWDD